MHSALRIFFFQLKSSQKLILKFLINFLDDFFVLFYSAINVPSITIIHWLNQNFFDIKLKNMEQLTKWFLVHNYWVNFVHCLLVFSLLSLIKGLQWRLERFKIILTFWFHLGLWFCLFFLVALLLHLTIMKFLFLNLDILANWSTWATYWLLCSFSQQSFFLSW